MVHFLGDSVSVDTSLLFDVSVPFDDFVLLDFHNVVLFCDKFDVGENLHCYWVFYLCFQLAFRFFDDGFQWKLFAMSSLLTLFSVGVAQAEEKLQMVLSCFAHFQIWIRQGHLVVHLDSLFLVSSAYDAALAHHTGSFLL